MMLDLEDVKFYKMLISIFSSYPSVFIQKIGENGIDEIGCMYLSKLCKNLRQLNLSKHLCS